MFGSPETQPGGRALKFYASQRLDIRRIETIKEGTEAVANRVRVKVVKNKVAPPFRQAEFDIEFGKGISTAGCLIDLGIEHNVVTKSGSFFSYGEDRLGQGRNNAKAFLNEHPEVAKEIEDKIYQALGIDRDGIEPIDDPAAVPPGVDPVTGRDRRLAATRRGRRPDDPGLHGGVGAGPRAALPARPRPGLPAPRPPLAHVAEVRRHLRTSSSSPDAGGGGARGARAHGLPRRRRLRPALRRGPPHARRVGARPDRAPPARARRRRPGLVARASDARRPARSAPRWRSSPGASRPRCRRERDRARALGRARAQGLRPRAAHDAIRAYARDDVTI
jgi:hypothetical protein